VKLTIIAGEPLLSGLNHGHTKYLKQFASNAPVQAAMHRYKDVIFIKAFSSHSPPLDVVEAIQACVLHGHSTDIQVKRKKEKVMRCMRIATNTVSAHN
jgi:4-hydroxy-L-threonine phosphate dehydrogenase PdxA